MSFFPSISAYTRSAEKPGAGLRKWVNMQEAALTCKADVLGQVKGIVYVFAGLASAECTLSDLRF